MGSMTSRPWPPEPPKKPVIRWRWAIVNGKKKLVKNDRDEQHRQ
jgi:hypothetical protein